jgi:syntaxin 5
MTARRRRGGSESEQAPLIVTSGGPYSVQDSWSQQNQTRHHASNGAGPNTNFLEDVTPKGKENTRTMTSRDRTTEFVNAIRSLQGRHVARTVAVRDPRKAKYIQSYAEFMMIARYSMIHTDHCYSFQQN